MARFFIDLDGQAADDVGVELDTVDHARNEAISRLGAYLQDHPGFAHNGHWRVDLRDATRRLLLHVIVATVDAQRPISRASFD